MTFWRRYNADMIKINPVQRDKDKVTRAMDAAPVMRAGRVALPEYHPMLAEILAEVAAFTFDDSHPHDDIVDNIIDAVNIEMNMADDPVGRMKNWQVCGTNSTNRQTNIGRLNSGAKRAVKEMSEYSFEKMIRIWFQLLGAKVLRKLAFQLPMQRSAGAMAGKLAKASAKDLIVTDVGKVKLQVNSRSIGGQVTGLRGGYMDDGFTGMLVLDDPDKPDDMLSKVKREAGHMRLKNTVRSRRMKDTTPIVMVQQRLHVNDSTWFMTNGGMGGIQFKVVSIPALVTKEYRETLPDWLKPEFDRDVLSSKPVMIDGVAHYSFWPAKKARRNYLHFEMLIRTRSPVSISNSLLRLAVTCLKRSGFSITAAARNARYQNRIALSIHLSRLIPRRKRVSLTTTPYKDRVYFIDGVRGKWEAPDLETNFVAFVNQCWKRNKECGTLRRIHVEDKSSGTGLIQSAAKKLYKDRVYFIDGVRGKWEAPDETNFVAFVNQCWKRNKECGTLRRIHVEDKSSGTGLIQSAAKNYDQDQSRSARLAEILAEVAAFTFDDSHPHDDIVDNIIDAVNIEMNMADDPVGRMKKLAGLRNK
ncbi:UNVERIFIED_ASMBLY: terminase large subunit [Shigella phage 2019SD1]|uniref:Terminase large subunit n=1 Tax=Shigella phage 2019SD1 TaxID=2848074 RepID=A0A6M5CAY4_9CAUD|nr:terminase large subunit [Shigella phage 2019SD1]